MATEALQRVKEAVEAGHGPSDVQFMSAARVFAGALGTHRPEAGTFKAIHAVLCRDQHASDKEAWEASGAKQRTYQQWKQSIDQVRADSYLNLGDTGAESSNADEIAGVFCVMSLEPSTQPTSSATTGMVQAGASGISLNDDPLLARFAGNQVRSPLPDVNVVTANLNASTGMPEEIAKTFTFLHLTNQFSSRIYASSDPHPHGIPEPAVWTQLCQDKRPCCSGFGKRQVKVRWGHMQRVAAKWCLWRVSVTEGEAQGHMFHKFVLAPAGVDYSDRGWQSLFSGRPSLSDKSPPQTPTFPKLVQAAFASAPDEPGKTIHRHVGVLVDWLDLLKTDQPAKVNSVASLSKRSLNAHNEALAPLERRQFNCPMHGIFWKKCDERSLPLQIEPLDQ